ncbi:UDP-N-acetylmuramoyl-tripeptide--D-alanyl-D-alanine ligase [Solitalea canadensis]|uniref:UDP-N-acetylmuramoyl-tripeptide--D-alanyl-D-alanine ligase n=1 Tax=Solitalea canadensis (strain ATCC 29591 / DSM 3403 / JCM 21819 / LMG 8368 / NBRC 15130 / NCIMB 12057 / USAM 9D) TaxID=929556 RepID=H8KM79_SOLCM|nr:UDP-N-acetylmuramoyl-tripeptide--D-alanyl-D-alanine ligase [Solitalea canadensis]AFD09261.1 UDP-N-acetylmuramoyl-tripeptide--D-alanyl-D-alanine ligase [Solitalea canadensis DSM 3403]
MNIQSLYNIYKEYPVISTDTRKIAPNSIFFALKGDNFNANQFAKQALESGAAYAVIDEEQYVQGDRYILVDNVLEALQQLAKFHRSGLNIPVLGITGSNGKTTSKELINAVLSQKFKTYATIGNLNNHIGVPLTLLAIDGSVDFAIIEMGANHQKEIQSLSSIADPDFGIITNVGRAHLEGFGGFEGVKKGKKELYDHILQRNGVIFVNQDNEFLVEMSVAHPQIVFYGTGTNNAVIGRRLERGENVSLEWTVPGEKQWHEVNANLVGSYNFENVLASICIGHYFGLTVDQIRKGVEGYVPTNNRSQAMKTVKNALICDYYNANPSSMAAAIDNFARTMYDNKIAILADMFELGDYSKDEHVKVIDQLKNKGVKKAILIGKHFYNADDQSTDYTFFETTEQAANYLKEHPIENGFVLVKGSRGMKLEGLISLL